MAHNRQEPSSKQIGVLRCIHLYWKQNRLSPTIREIGERTGIQSSSVVNYQLKRLEEMGCVVRHTRRSRTIMLTEKALRYLDTEDVAAVEVSPHPDHILEELYRLRAENAKFRGLKVNASVVEQLHAQREHLEKKYGERIRELERDRDRLIDDLVRLQMRPAS